MLLDNKRIFIVEDNQYNLSIAITFLEQEGATVQFERWRPDSIDRLLAFLPVDVILLDIVLGKISGEDVFDNIRTMPELTDVPIVALTASDVNMMNKLKNKGFSGFIGKPIFPSFAAHVHNAIQGKPVWIASGSV